jgi:hypothetical protein
VQRKGHPRGTGTLDLATYLGLHHVVASTLRGPVRGYMDEYLEQLGYRRNVVPGAAIYAGNGVASTQSRRAGT